MFVQAFIQVAKWSSSSSLCVRKHPQLSLSWLVAFILFFYGIASAKTACYRLYHSLTPQSYDALFVLKDAPYPWRIPCFSGNFGAWIAHLAFFRISQIWIFTLAQGPFLHRALGLWVMWIIELSLQSYWVIRAVLAMRKMRKTLKTLMTLTMKWLARFSCGSCAYRWSCNLFVTYLLLSTWKRLTFRWQYHGLASPRAGLDGIYAFIRISARLKNFVSLAYCHLS